jgi:serine/threonine-protein kinase
MSLPSIEGLEDQTFFLIKKPAEGSEVGPPNKLSRYRVLEEIARGAMGAVLRVHDPELDRILALKILLEEHRLNPEIRRRFLEEARLTSQLQHPGIVAVHEQGTMADGQPYFTMKLVEGQTLATLLPERENPLDQLPQWLSIFEQVCQTIAYAHSRGVIHRDLKPSNIMVGQFGEVQVMDWGVAKHLINADEKANLLTSTKDFSWGCSEAKQTSIGCIVGTPDYMAPEQARGEEIDPRADVFGLGAILCEILTGTPPYRLGKQTGAAPTHFRDLTPAYAALAQCRAEAPLIELATQCLAEQSENRPANVGEVVQRLVRWREGVRERLRQAELERAAAQASEESVRAKVAAQRQTRRLWLVLLGVSLMLLFATVLAGWWVNRRQFADQARLDQLLTHANQLSQRASQSAPELAIENWREALVLLDQAAQAAEVGWVDRSSLQQLQQSRAEVKQQIQQWDANHQLLDTLADIRLHKEQDFEKADTDARYREAFAIFGLPVEGGQSGAEAFAEALKQHPTVRAEVIVALDDWASVLRKEGRPDAQWKGPFLLAQAVDEDTWRLNVRQEILENRSVNYRWISKDLFAPLGAVRLASVVRQIRTAQRRARLQELALTADLSKCNPASIQLLAAELARESMTKPAIDLLRSALRYHPEDVWLNFDLAALLEATEPIEALRYYSVARAIRPELGHSMAHLLAKLKRTDEAIDLLKDLTRLRPTNREHFSCLAALYLEKNQFQAAEQAMVRALALEPNAPRPRIALIEALLKHTLDLNRPMELVQEGLRMDSGRAEYHIMLARIYLRQNQPTLAELSYRRAYLARPTEYAIVYEYAQFLAEQGRKEDALGLVDQLVQTHPAELEGREFRATLLLALDRKDETMEELQAILNLRPTHSEYLTHLAKLNLQKGQYAQALPLLRRAWEHKPHSPWLLPTLIEALYRGGHQDEASQWVDRHFNDLPNNPFVLYNLGNDAMETGDTPSAIRLLRRSISLHPYYAEAQCNLGLCYQRLGQFPLAWRHLQFGHALGKQRGSDWHYPSLLWVAKTRRFMQLEPRLLRLARREEMPSKEGDYAILSQLCIIKGYHCSRYILMKQFLELSRGRFHPNEELLISLTESALQAGLAQSKDSVLLDERQRGEALGQGLRWMTEVADRIEAGQKHADPKRRAHAQSVLQQIHQSKTLAQTRSSAGLARFPQSEQHAWSRLWDQLAPGADR